MQTNKEALLSIYRGEMPSHIPPETKCYAGAVFLGDRYFGPENEGLDDWGVCWRKLGPDPSLDGMTVSPNSKKLEDISKWKEEVHFPDLEKMPVRDMLNRMIHFTPEPDNYVKQVVFLSGPWERVNQLYGMEESLCALYEEPEAVKGLLSAIVDYKIKCIDIAVEAVDPDVIHMQDDWGSSKNLFFSPQMWREFIKPGEKKICEHIHKLGKLYEHHSCGYIASIFSDLVEIGVDVINPLNVCNDITELKRLYGDKITLAGGVDNYLIDNPETSEEVIRAEARRVLDAYAPGGRYIPKCIFVNGRVRDIFMDEVEFHGKNIYKQRTMIASV